MSDPRDLAERWLRHLVWRGSDYDIRHRFGNGWWARKAITDADVTFDGEAVIIRIPVDVLEGRRCMCPEYFVGQLDACPVHGSESLR